VARDTPHLVAPRHLEDTRVALWTRAGILSEHGDRLLIVLRTRVFGVAVDALVRVAVRAHPVVAQPALVGRGDTTATIGTRTRHEELLALARLLSINPPALYAPVLALLLMEAELESVDLRLDIPNLVPNLLLPNLPTEYRLELLDAGLRFGQEVRDLLLPILSLQKPLGELVANELHVPPGITVHTLGLDGILEQEALHTRSARALLAGGAGDLLVDGLVVPSDADTAVLRHGRHCFYLSWNKRED